jgi:hypothetical protein
MIIINKINNSIFRFEPNNMEIKECQSDNLNTKLQDYFEQYFNIKTFTSSTSLPCFGLQSTQANEPLALKINYGFCTSWSLWFLETTLIYPTINHELLLKSLYNTLKKKYIKTSFTQMILNYGEYIFNVSKNLDKYIEYKRLPQKKFNYNDIKNNKTIAFYFDFNNPNDPITDIIDIKNPDFNLLSSKIDRIFKLTTTSFLNGVGLTLNDNKLYYSNIPKSMVTLLYIKSDNIIICDVKNIKK